MQADLPGGGPRRAIIDLERDADVTIEGCQSYARLGMAVAGSGDINGDGIDDFAVGAPYMDTGGYTDAGEVLVIFGARDLPATINSGASLDGIGLRFSGRANSIKLGWALAGADVNGDGFSDLVAGAPRGGAKLAGSAYILFGGAALPAALATNTLGDKGAVITGAFSIAQQAMSLGLLPRMNITHTSETEQGQIYIGQINWMILLGVTLLVLVFRSSSNLASAYGVAVNTSMVVDTLLALVFFWKARTLPLYIVIPALLGIFVIELTFLAANGLKLAKGGYVPVLFGATVILLMVTWMRGRFALAAKLRRESIELVSLLQSLEKRQPTRVAGAAVFLQTDPIYAPSALMHNLKHNRVLHDILVFISVETTDEPRADPDNRVSVKQLPLGAWLVEARFGYMEQPDVPAALRACESQGLSIDPAQAPYFLGRRVIRTSAKSALPFWQQRIFIMLANQSARAIEFFLSLIHI